jgi:hypothetical protein
MRNLRQGRLTLRLALLFAVTTISCHPTEQEREQAQEAERQKAIAASRQMLAQFAERHGAVPVELFDPNPLAQPFTAQVQQQLEGRVVAFTANVLDIVRVADQSYRLILGSPIVSPTVISLKSDEQQIAQILAGPRKRFSDYLVAAKIDEVVPLTLRLEPCDQPDCTTVAFETVPFSSPLHITGDALDIEPVR